MKNNCEKCVYNVCLGSQPICAMDMNCHTEKKCRHYVNERGWISVDERCPTTQDRYRVLIKTGSISQSIREYESLYLVSGDKGKWMFGGDWDKVTHWKDNK